MADFDNGYADVTTLQGRELFLLYDPLFREGLNMTVDNFVEQYGVNEISDVPGLTADLAAKQTEIDINTVKPGTFLGITNEIALTIIPGTVGIGLSQTVKDQIAANTAKSSSENLLPLNNTWTGTNTFNNTGIGIRVGRITGDELTSTYLDLGGTSGFATLRANTYLFINAGPTGVNTFYLDNTTIFNSGGQDIDFDVRRIGNTSAIHFDASTDTTRIGSDNFTVTSDNITGVAGSETGTWTPVPGNAPTTAVFTNVSGRYNKVGETVNVWGRFTLPAFTSTFGMRIEDSSLPFTVSNNDLQGTGYHTDGNRFICFDRVGFSGFSLFHTNATNTNAEWGSFANGTTYFHATYITTQ